MKKIRNKHRLDKAGGYRDGAAWCRSLNTAVDPLSTAEAAQHAWLELAAKSAAKGGSKTEWLRRGRRYASAFLRGAGVRGRLVPIPIQLDAAAVLCAPSSARKMKWTLERLRELPFREIIVVLNDPSPQFIAAARTVPGVTDVFSPGLADPDVGRALGASLATAGTVLFADGENPGNVITLARFLWECGTRLDVALNDVSSQLGFFHTRENTYRLTEFLNRTMKRRDLQANSLAILPYALSRRALNKIDPSSLAVPPKAHADAIFAGLRIGTGGYIKPSTPSSLHEAANWKKAVDDHAEAWRAALKHRGSRLFFPIGFATVVCWGNRHEQSGEGIPYRFLAWTNGSGIQEVRLTAKEVTQ